MLDLGMRRSLDAGYDDVLARVPEALKSEGFGVLTEIDVRDTLKKKLGVDFRRYKILGTCNPPLAQQALSLDLGAGLALPCNVIVYEGDDGRTVVEAIDPSNTVAARDPRFAELARTVRDKLARALERL
jgi:uncharacterized protein (DUF302 family)